MKKINLSIFDFINIFINKCLEKHIISFNKKELEKQLSCFLNDDKLISLFTSFEYNDIKIDLNETINMLIMGGYLYSVKTDNDTVYILKSNKYINYSNVLEELIETYCDAKKVSENYNSLKIFISDSNNSVYTNVVGYQGTDKIKYDIITDGDIVPTNIRLEKGVKNYFKNPIDDTKTKIDDADFEIVRIKNSSYILRRVLINNEVIDNVLYTNASNIDDLEDIIFECKIKRKKRGDI